MEASFFEGGRELAETVSYLLGQEDQRKRIAEAGYQRSQRSGYSISDRIQTIIEK